MNNVYTTKDAAGKGHWFGAYNADTGSDDHAHNEYKYMSYGEKIGSQTNDASSDLADRAPKP